MKKNVKKLTLVALASGMLFQFGCLTDSWTQWLRAAAVTTVVEWVTDNNAVFDLFPDDLGPA